MWITGGGSGLGRAMAVALGRRRAKVLVTGRRADKLDETVQQVVAAGGEARALVGDVASDEDLQAAVDLAVSAFGRLDVAVANAGYSVSGTVAETSRERWSRQLEINVVSAARTAAIALPALLETNGRIGLVGSVAAHLPAPKAGPYVASKAALLAVGRTLHTELVGTGVSCTVLQPGFVESEIGQVDDDGVFHPEREDRRPQKLMWNAEDAAEAMLWGLARRKVEYSFTGHGRLAVVLGRHTPNLVGGLIRRFGRP